MQPAYEAYFDESGDRAGTSTVLTVAGFVSTVDKWRRFTEEWTRILTEAGLPEGTIFHMKEFAHGHKEFDIFKEKPAQKAALMSQLVRCTRKHVNKAFSASIVLKDWERLNQRYKMIEAWGPPYSFCALHCIEMVQMWARKNGIKYPVRFFFEDGAHQRGELKRLAKEQYKTEPTFPKKALATQLQCCDLLAWKNRKALDAAVTRGGTRDIEDMRSVLRSLEEVNKIANRYGAHDYKSLVKVCQLKLEARSVKGS